MYACFYIHVCCKCMKRLMLNQSMLISLFRVETCILIYARSKNIFNINTSDLIIRVKKKAHLVVFAFSGFGLNHSIKYLCTPQMYVYSAKAFM